MRYLLSLCVLGFSVFAAETPKSVDKKIDLKTSQNTVEFLAVGRPSMLKIKGVAKPENGANPLEGKLTLAGDSLKGDAAFELNTLDTANNMRNGHMKEKYLETGRFPKAEFTLKECKLPENIRKGDGKAEKIPFKGTLRVHGVESPVEGFVNIERTGPKAHFGFEFGTKIPAHKIALPSFMGVTVAEDVTINVAIEGPLT